MFTRVLAAGLGAVIAVSGILAVGNSAEAAAEKASICHVDDDGGYHLIRVATKALSAHATHGDASIGESVPGMDGYVFGEGCALCDQLRSLRVVPEIAGDRAERPCRLRESPGAPGVVVVPDVQLVTGLDTFARQT